MLWQEKVRIELYKLPLLWYQVSNLCVLVLVTKAVVVNLWRCYIFLSELENRLLVRFDAASQRRELSTMAECAKILSQVREQQDSFF